MTRPRKVQEAKDIEEMDDSIKMKEFEKSQGASTPDDGAPGEPPPIKRRKRKTAKATAVPIASLPQELVDFAAFAPLAAASEGFKLVTTKRDPVTRRVVSEGVRLKYDETAVAAVSASFKAWLASMDVELSPGWALVACYSMAFGSAMPQALGELGARPAPAQAVPQPVQAAPVASVTVAAEVKTDATPPAVQPASGDVQPGAGSTAA